MTSGALNTIGRLADTRDRRIDNGNGGELRLLATVLVKTFTATLAVSFMRGNDTDMNAYARAPVKFRCPVMDHIVGQSNQQSSLDPDYDTLSVTNHLAFKVEGKIIVSMGVYISMEYLSR